MYQVMNRFNTRYRIHCLSPFPPAQPLTSYMIKTRIVHNLLKTRVRFSRRRTPRVKISRFTLVISNQSSTRQDLHALELALRDKHGRSPLVCRFNEVGDFDTVV